MTTTPRIRTALVTNIPAPYRLPVYAAVADSPDIVLCVYFCSAREPDRAWDLPADPFQSVYLRERYLRLRGRFIHANPDIWSQLRALRPQVVITTGFNPTHLLAFAYARRHGAVHVPMTDGTHASEARLTGLHRWVRRLVYARSAAFIGASEGSRALYQDYGIAPGRVFCSALCADNAAFARAADDGGRNFDFLFCGRFVASKNPLFALEVARDVARRLGRSVSILFVGSGPLEDRMRAQCAAAADRVQAVFAGFARQAELPALYASAAVFLFPTQADVWGVVANEACAAGLPVLVSPHAGCAGELVRDQENGFVLPLEVGPWAAAAARLLGDGVLHAAMAARGRVRVQAYTHARAAQGICAAIRAGTAAGSACGS